MCFSANASFGAGTVLIIAGIASVRKVESRSQLAFAAIPLIFGIQQFFEGFLWLAFKHPLLENSQQSLTVAFLLFALVVWPLYVPYAVFRMESDPWRKKALMVLLVIGGITSFYTACSLLLYDVRASAGWHHIHYQLSFPIINNSFAEYAGDTFYFLATVIPPFLSSNKKIQLIGGLLFGAYLISQFFFGEFVISVWCYFAAVISIAIYSVMTDLSKKSIFAIK